MSQRNHVWSTPMIVATIAALTMPVVCLWPDSTPVREIAAPVVDCSLAEAEVERLTRRKRELEGYVQTLRVSEPDAAPQQAAEAAALAAVPVAAELDEAPSDTIEARFIRDLEHERFDQQRSLQVTRALATQLARTSPDTRVESVECTSSICRCELQHQTRWAQTSIDSSLGGVELPMSGVEYNYDESTEAPRTIAYIVLGSS